MSTQINKGADAGIASLPLGRETVNLDQEKSRVRYLWNPFVSIPLVGGSGLKFRIGRDWEYYGVGAPREERDAYEARQGHMLQRCTAYPIWNIYYMQSKFDRGEFSAEEARKGNALGDQVPMIQRQEYAGVCAADFLIRYSDYGARVLTPFVGIEPEDGLVQELFSLVQPNRNIKLTNLRQERDGNLTDEDTLLFDLADRGPCDERIKGANLKPADQKMAQELRRVMLGGARSARTTAIVDWDDLQQQLSNSALGHKGHKKGPSAYDAQVALLLGEPVPSVVASRPTSDPEVGKALNLLTQIAANGIPTAAPAPGTINLTPEQLTAMVNQAVEQKIAAMQDEYEQQAAAVAVEAPPEDNAAKKKK